MLDVRVELDRLIVYLERVSCVADWLLRKFMAIKFIYIFERNVSILR
jgi:hypothetical protein